MYLRAGMGRMLTFLVFVVLVLTTASIVQINRSNAAVQGCDDLLRLASGLGRAVDGVFVNKEVCDAYRFLLERNGNGDRGTQCYQSQNDRILKLNPQFAVGLAKALAEMERLYGGKNIVQSGFRCDGSNGNHPRGCAADIIWASCQKDTMGFKDSWRCSSDGYDKSTNSWNTSEQKWIDANGRSEPYNIQLRLRGAPEGHHVEPTNIKGCISGSQVLLNNSSPFSSVGDAVRRAFGMPTQQTQAIPAQPAVPSQPVSVSQNPLGAFNTEPLPSGVSSQIQTENYVSVSSSSAADRLEELAFGPTTPTTTTSATSVPLVVSGSNAAMLTGTQQASTSAVTSSQGVISPSQTTFISGDLAWQDQTISSDPVSGYQAILITIRAALNRVLQYLVPFNAHGSQEPHEYEY